MLRKTGPAAAKGEPDSFGLVATIVTAGCVGEVALMVVPLLLGSVVKAFGIREGTAGVVSSLEICAIALSAVGASTLFKRFNTRFVARLAVPAVLIGNAISIASHSWALFVVARGFTGLGEGVLCATANVSAARTARPHRTFAILLTSIVVATVAASVGITALTTVMGPRGAFVAMFLGALVCSPPLLWFPDRSAGKGDRPEVRFQPGRGLRLLIAAWFLYMASNGLWAYAERIGASLGLTLGEISAVVTVCAVIGALGPIAAGFVGVRHGRTVPILGSLAIVVVTSLTLAGAVAVPAFSISAVVVCLAFMFLVTYLRGLMASLDPSGKLVGAGMGLVTFGSALGPLAAGLILNAGGSYRTIGYMTVACYLITAVFMLPVALEIDSVERA